MFSALWDYLRKQAFEIWVQKEQWDVNVPEQRVTEGFKTYKAANSNGLQMWEWQFSSSQIISFLTAVVLRPGCK